MNAIVKFLRSPIGQKWVMSLTGLFLISFLIVHLSGNILLLIPDDGRTFSAFVDWMESRWIIRILSILLFLGFGIHIVQGLLLYRSNRKAKGTRYAVTATDNSSWSARHMALLGIGILLFLILHLWDFFYPMKVLKSFSHHQLYDEVLQTFQNPLWVAAYVLGMIFLGFHLSHGFQSAFQTLGVRHPKYTPLLIAFGKLFAFLVPLLFAIIPIALYFKFS